MQSGVKQNLHAETEADVNKLSNILLNASYTYLALVRLARLLLFLIFLKRTEGLCISLGSPGDVF